MGHTEDLLALRGEGPEGEMYYRRQVMRLLGAEPIPDLEPPGGRALRRVEGTVALRVDGATLLGLVMFAVGSDGTGAKADVRNKDGGYISARSALVGHPDADFILLVTTGEPPRDVADLADEKSDLLYIGPSLRRSIWVMGLPELVARAERFMELVQEDEADSEHRNRFVRWFLGMRNNRTTELLASPLLIP